MSRISPGTLLVLIFAVMFGLLGAYIVRKNLQAEPQKTAQQAPQVWVVPRASTDLKSGREITLSDLAPQRMTNEQLKASGITKAFMTDSRQIIGRTLKTDLMQGDTFDTSVFYPEGTGPSVVDQLEPGMRAVTVEVEVNGAVEGFAGAGTWVDLLFRAENDVDEDKPETTVTLLERVQVLALNRNTFEGANVNPRDSRQQSATVVVAVIPEQAAALRVAEGRGTMSLALRHPDDIVRNGSDAPKTLDELLKRPNSKHKMEVYRGHQLTEVEFKTQDRLTPTEELISRDDDRKDPRDRTKLPPEPAATSTENN